MPRSSATSPEHATPAQERLEEYGRIFHAALTSRERTTTGVVLTFGPAHHGQWVADLAAREAACCPFMSYLVTLDDGLIGWETNGTPEMQAILDEY